MLKKLLVIVGVMILVSAILTPNFANATQLTNLWCTSVLHGTAIPGATVPQCTPISNIITPGTLLSSINTASCPPGYVQTSTAQCTPISNIITPGCDQTLWSHVYNPARLQIVDQCKTVSGTIDSIRVEQDGDFHIRLRVDPQFANLINSANVNGQYGDLVLEPICQNPVTQPDAVAACANFHQSISIPEVGTHVIVTGSYVHDLEHGGWAEIHPVSNIAIG